MKVEKRFMTPMSLTELRGLITSWYACQVYGNEPTNKLKSQDKEEMAYRLIEELEAKSAKWDCPQTQADLELAAAIKEMACANTLYFKTDKEMIGFPEISDFISWYQEQKGGNHE